MKKASRKFAAHMRRRHPAGARLAQVMQALGTDKGPEDEPQPEGHSDEPHPLRAVCRRRNVRDVGLGHSDIPAARAGEQPRYHHEPQGGGVILKAGAASEQNVRQG